MDSDQLPLSRAQIDRDAAARTRPALLAELTADPRTRVLRVLAGHVPTEGADAAVEVRYCSTAELTEGSDLIYLGRTHQTSYVAELLPAFAPDGSATELAGQTSNLRDIGWQMNSRDAGLAATALALANWHATHTHCPRCGARTVMVEAGWVRRCEQDESLHFPRTDPAVIMAVVDDDDRILLGHAAAWPDGQFSTSAGFVEPGESLEAAVRREVMEETGIAVGEVVYQASQPWPFPASLMLGFRGRALTTEPQPDGVEITEARFFTRAEIAAALAAGELRLPRPTSISRGLIEEWYGQPLPV